MAYLGPHWIFAIVKKMQYRNLLRARDIDNDSGTVEAYKWYDERALSMNR